MSYVGMSGKAAIVFANTISFHNKALDRCHACANLGQ
jgi:hypothetical protein